MPDGYYLKSHRFKTRAILALASTSTRTSCVDELFARNDPNGILQMSVRSIDAISRNGMRYATTHSLVRPLSKNVYLVEFKSKSTAWRMAAYLHEGQQQGHPRVIPVLLEHFKGHGGKRGTIPKGKIEALEAKALIAKSLVEKEISNDNL